MPALAILAIGIAVLALAAAAGAKGAEVVVRRLSKRGGPLVSFSHRHVFWKTDKKTGKDLYRTEVEQDLRGISAALSKVMERPVDAETTALAAMLASEVGSGRTASPPLDLGALALAKVGVAHAAKNYARTKGTTVLRLIAPDGKLGSQHGRYAASKHPPTKQDIEIAEEVLRGKLADPTGGAIQWDSPRTQDILVARGETGYRLSSAALAAVRQAEGKRETSLPGVDPRYLRLWRPAEWMSGWDEEMGLEEEGLVLRGNDSDLGYDGEQIVA